MGPFIETQLVSLPTSTKFSSPRAPAHHEVWAIGGSAARGEISLATVLVIGFALHNATEGLGIVAPLAATADRPSWGFLPPMGLIGGGPTVLGTAGDRQFTSEAVSAVFLTLPAGSILYVVIQLLGTAHRAGGGTCCTGGCWLAWSAASSPTWSSPPVALTPTFPPAHRPLARLRLRRQP